MRPWSRRNMLLAIIGMVVFATGMLWLSQRFATDRAISRERARLAGTATLAASNFRRQIDTFELVATALSADPEIAAVLESGDGRNAARLNERLATLSDLLDASVIYLMDSRGDTIVSSNYRQPDSFLGENYRFRNYFTRAIEDGRASQFALGTRSRIPGLFLARRIDVAGRPAGVLVIKIRFDRLEREWARSIGEAFVADSDGVIIVTSHPSLRFRTVAPMSESRRAELRVRRAFGNEPLELHPAFRSKDVLASGRWEGQEFLSITMPAVGNRRLTVIEPIRAVANAARNFAWLVIATLASGLVAVAVVVAARRRARSVRQEAARRDEARDLRDRFEMANRLSSLGQVAAGVGHEINQPLAAIGMRASNAMRLLEGRRLDEARTTIAEIDGLVTRAGAITGELRKFARRSDRTLERVGLAAVLDGLELLMSDAIHQHGSTLTVEMEFQGMAVLAEQTRLEQVLVNLVQNALDAGEGATRVTIVARQFDERVHITVSDDGPGIPDSIRRSIFQPFTTSKSHGLGLGLVISRDIVAEFGGELSLIEGSSTGAAFLIDLVRAP